MDSRYTPEQLALRAATAALASDLGPRNVGDLDDDARRAKLAAAGADAGWWWLRGPADDRTPVASGVEVAIVARELGRAAADTPFLGPVVASDLARAAKVDLGDDATGIVLDSSLLDFAVVPPGATLHGVAVDCAGLTSAVALRPADGDDDACRLVRVPISHPSPATDLTRAIERVAIEGDSVEVLGEAIDRDALDRARALVLSITVADLVGTMEAALDTTCEYARERRQFGVAIGSFQAVQHLLAEARVLVEGAISVAQYAAWAVDARSPDDALEAGAVAKAYCAAAARTVCETAIQVHGGIGNTWECFVHVYLRRALFAASLFGDEGHSLRALAARRMGYSHGV
ncbi:MAG: acyl-CoA dehydrogenase family protein [Acidimicrobiia bacterium]